MQPGARFDAIAGDQPEQVQRNDRHLFQLVPFGPRSASRGHGDSELVPLATGTVRRIHGAMDDDCAGSRIQ
jgi:hypothetical protein